MEGVTLKPRTYYAAEIKLTKCNCVHRAILATQFKVGPEHDVILLNDGYEDKWIKRSLQDIWYINIITEIPGMTDFPEEPNPFQEVRGIFAADNTKEVS